MLIPVCNTLPRGLAQRAPHGRRRARLEVQNLTDGHLIGHTNTALQKANIGSASCLQAIVVRFCTKQYADAPVFRTVPRAAQQVTYDPMQFAVLAADRNVRGSAICLRDAVNISSVLDFD